MFKVASFFWYTYVVVMFFSLAPEAAKSIDESFALLFVTSIALVLPEVFKDE